MNLFKKSKNNDSKDSANSNAQKPTDNKGKKGHNIEPKAEEKLETKKLDTHNQSSIYVTDLQKNSQNQNSQNQGTEITYSRDKELSDRQHINEKLADDADRLEKEADDKIEKDRKEIGQRVAEYREKLESRIGDNPDEIERRDKMELESRKISLENMIEDCHKDISEDKETIKKKEVEGASTYVSQIKLRADERGLKRYEIDCDENLMKLKACDELIVKTKEKIAQQKEAKQKALQEEQEKQRLLQEQEAKQQKIVEQAKQIELEMARQLVQEQKLQEKAQENVNLIKEMKVNSIKKVKIAEVESESAEVAKTTAPENINYIHTNYKITSWDRLKYQIKYNTASVATAVIVSGCILVSSIHFASRYVPSFKSAPKEISPITAPITAPTNTGENLKTKQGSEKKLTFDLGFKFDSSILQNITKGVNITKLFRKPDIAAKFKNIPAYATPEERPEIFEILSNPDIQLTLDELKTISVCTANPKNISDWKEFLSKCNAMTVLGSPRGIDRFHWHNGFDVFGPLGTPVNACVGGQVVFSGKSNGGYGGLVIIKTFIEEEEHYMFFGHLDPKTTVKRGDIVKSDTIIGHIGDHFQGPHVHVELLSKLSNVYESKKEFPKKVENGINKIGIDKSELPKFPRLNEVWEKGVWTDSYVSLSGKYNDSSNRGFVIRNIFLVKPVAEGKMLLPIPIGLVKNVRPFNKELPQQALAMIQHNKDAVSSQNKRNYKSFSHAGEY